MTSDAPTTCALCSAAPATTLGLCEDCYHDAMVDDSYHAALDQHLEMMDAMVAEADAHFEALFATL